MCLCVIFCVMCLACCGVCLVFVCLCVVLSFKDAFVCLCLSYCAMLYDML